MKALLTALMMVCAARAAGPPLPLVLAGEQSAKSLGGGVYRLADGRQVNVNTVGFHAGGRRWTRSGGEWRSDRGDLIRPDALPGVYRHTVRGAEVGRFEVSAHDVRYRPARARESRHLRDTDGRGVRRSGVDAYADDLARRRARR